MIPWNTDDTKIACARVVAWIRAGAKPRRFSVVEPDVCFLEERSGLKERHERWGWRESED